MPSHHSHPSACSPFLWMNAGARRYNKNINNNKGCVKPHPFFIPSLCTSRTAIRPQLLANSTIHRELKKVDLLTKPNLHPFPTRKRGGTWVEGQRWRGGGLAWLQWEQMRAHLLPWQLPPTRKARSVGWLKNANQHLNESIKGSWCRGGRWDQHFTNFVSSSLLVEMVEDWWRRRLKKGENVSKIPKVLRVGQWHLIYYTLSIELIQIYYWFDPIMSLTWSLKTVIVPIDSLFWE